jgi:hypothetical protein
MHAKKTLALALAAVAVAASGAPLALAGPIQVSDDRRGDAGCDGAPCPDLKSAVADTGILDPSQLFFIVTQHNAVDASSVPRIAINTRGTSSSEPEFYVEHRGSRTGVFKAKTGRKTGPAALRSSGGASLSWTFLPRAIGSPPSFGWRVEIVRDASRIDVTPDRGYRQRVLR